MGYRVLLLMVLIASCNKKPTVVSPADIRISESVKRSQCEAVGDIEERIESPTPSDDLKQQVRQSIRERAAELRATDLVFQVEESDQSYAFAKAEAYRCKR